MSWNIEPVCIFCATPQNERIVENTYAYARYDKFPVTEGHVLVIPKHHYKDWFDMTDLDIQACNELLFEMRERLQQNDPTIQGFNVGWNSGIVAGQTVFHCHIHLIPRRKGDTENPKGGVRKSVNGVGDYEA